MIRRRRVSIMLLVVALLLTLPAMAFASKNVYKAQLRTDSELHEVVGSSARGAFVMASGPAGYQFRLTVRGLSGPASGAHIHAPATASENAPVAISLCGNPAPAAVATCTTDADGNLLVDGVISSSLLSQWGVTGATLQGWLENGTSYVNVHTNLNPAGEVRGQINP